MCEHPRTPPSGTADIYLTSLASDPRYTRLRATGEAIGEYTGFTGHVHPTTATTFTAYRYYALTVSVGLLSGSTPLSVEIQEFQPLVEAPAPASTLSAFLCSVTARGTTGRHRLHGRGSMPAGSGLYTVTLSKRMPTVPTTGGLSPDLGYMEVWDSFKVRSAYLQGQAWSVASFPNQSTGSREPFERFPVGTSSGHRVPQ